jgi:hypothetical protein
MFAKRDYIETMETVVSMKLNRALVMWASVTTCRGENQNFIKDNMFLETTMYGTLHLVEFTHASFARSQKL